MSAFVTTHQKFDNSMCQQYRYSIRYQTQVIMDGPPSASTYFTVRVRNDLTKVRYFGTRYVEACDNISNTRRHGSSVAEVHILMIAKYSGAAARTPSNRSKQPPCPGKMVPESCMRRLTEVTVRTSNGFTKKKQFTKPTFHRRNGSRQRNGFYKKNAFTKATVDGSNEEQWFHKKEQSSRQK